MLNEKQRLEKAEKQINELVEAREEIERRIEMRSAVEEEVERYLKTQSKGFFRFALDLFRLLVVLAVIYTGGHKALDLPWINWSIK